MSFSVEELAAKIYLYAERRRKDNGYAANHPEDVRLIELAWSLLLTKRPDLVAAGHAVATTKLDELAAKYLEYIPASVRNDLKKPQNPLFTPAEQAALDKLPVVNGQVLDYQAVLQRTALMMSVMSNMMNMRHESLKSISSNLRG